MVSDYCNSVSGEECVFIAIFWLLNVKNGNILPLSS